MKADACAWCGCRLRAPALVDALLKAHGGDNSPAAGAAAGGAGRPQLAIPLRSALRLACLRPTALSSALSEGRAIWSSGPEQLHMKVLQMVPARQSGSLPA